MLSFQKRAITKVLVIFIQLAALLAPFRSSGDFIWDSFQLCKFFAHSVTEFNPEHTLRQIQFSPHAGNATFLKNRITVVSKKQLTSVAGAQ